jgi:molybdopterin synthase catalytic subunit/molybdopterin synthase sulfur carrier subunit
MKVSVKLFAVAKQWAETDSVELDLPADARVADLRKSLVCCLPRLEQFGPHLRFAVNSEYANEETTIPASAEIACIPPVSGG